MTRRALVTAALIGIALALASAAVATTNSTPPPWLKRAEQLTLKRVFENAKPTAISYINYPTKIAVVFTFNHVVICGGCSAPSNAMLPSGRVIRLSYSRATHQVTGALRFCEIQGSQPPRANCLKR